MVLGHTRGPKDTNHRNKLDYTIPEINRDWLPLSVADERLQTSWGCEKQTKSTMRNETGVLSTTIPSLLVMEAKK
jgi:hypothetical protein